MIDRLCFGAASIGNLYREVADDAARDVVDAAWEGGVRSFDTAPHYGLGLSERRLGAALRDRPRTEYRVSTKVGRVLEPLAQPGGTDAANGFAVAAHSVRRWDPTPAGVERSLTASLERMGLDHVDRLYLHDPDVYDLDEGLRIGVPALVALRESGVVAEVGVGVNSVAAALRAVRETDIDVVMIAGRYTLLEQPAAGELLPECRRRGIRVVAAAVFNSGLLAAAEPSHAHYDYGAVPADVVRRVERVRHVCDSFDVTLPAAAMQFPLRHPAVSEIAVGTSRADGIRANIAALGVRIPDALWQSLEDEGLVAPLATDA
jgi:D-threo-aldose 1-dehydrogenase